MRFTKRVIFLAALLAAQPCFALDAVPQEKSTLLKRIQCSRESNTPPGDGMGGLWGCYSPKEDVKLWINSPAESPDMTSNIKLVAVLLHGSRPPIVAKLWAQVVAETYAPQAADAIVKEFLACKAPREWSLGESRKVSLQCQKGPSASEHTLIVE